MFHPQRFRDQTASQVLALGRGLTELVSSVNTDAYANAVFYTGHQPETAAVQELPPRRHPGRTYGRWEMQQSDPNVVLQATANEQAKATRLNAQQLAPAFTLTMSPAWWEPGDIWLGDLVQVQVRDGRLDIPNPDEDGKRRVVDIAITLDDDGTETVVLTANVPVPPDGTTDPPPPPAPGGAGKVPKISHRLKSLHHRVSKLELVAAGAAGPPPGGATPPYANLLDYGGAGGDTTDNSAAVLAAIATEKPVWFPESQSPVASGASAIFNYITRLPTSACWVAAVGLGLTGAMSPPCPAPTWAGSAPSISSAPTLRSVLTPPTSTTPPAIPTRSSTSRTSPLPPPAANRASSASRTATGSTSGTARFTTFSCR